MDSVTVGFGEVEMYVFISDKKGPRGCFMRFTKIFFWIGKKL